METKKENVLLTNQIKLYFTLLFLPLLVLSSIYIWHSRTLIKSNSKIQFQNLIKNIRLLYLENNINEIEKNFLDLYKRSADLSFEKEKTTILWAEEAYKKTYIKSIAFYSKEVSFIYPFGEIQSNTDKISFERSVEWSKPYKKNGKWMISLNKKNSENAILTMEIKMDYFSSLLKKVELENGAGIYILNELGDILASNKDGKESNMNFRYMDLKDNSVFFDSDKIMAISKINRNSWRLVGIMPTLNLNNYLKNAILNTMFLILIAIIFFIVIASIIIRTLKKESVQIYRFLRDIKNGNKVKIHSKYSEFIRIYDEISSTKTELEAYKKKSEIDSLTKFYNKNSLEDIMRLYEKNLESFYLFIYDLDDFKMVNDNYGHDVGDTVLKRISEKVQNLLGENDLGIRFGGEEFIILFNDYNEKEVKGIAEKIRIEIKRLKWREEGLKTTISGGLVKYNGKSFDELIKEADKLLYRSKNKGKDKISFRLK